MQGGGPSAARRGLQVARPTDLDVLADDVEAIEEEVVRDVTAVEGGVERAVEGVEEQLISFSRNFTVLAPERRMAAAKSEEMRMMERKEAAALKKLKAMERKFPGGDVPAEPSRGWFKLW